MRRCLSVMMWIKSDVMLRVVREERARTREIYHLERERKMREKRTQTHINIAMRMTEKVSLLLFVVLLNTVGYYTSMTASSLSHDDEEEEEEEEASAGSHSTATNSTSNFNVAFPGMTPPAPLAPYPNSGGMIKTRFPPTFMPSMPSAPSMPSSQP